MQRAIIIGADFDPVPSVRPAADVAVAVTAEAPAGVPVGYPVAEGAAAPAGLAIGADVLAAGGFSGRAGATLVVPTASGIVVAVGTGDLDGLSTSVLRDAAGAFANATATQGAVAFVLPEGIDVGAAAAAVVEGIVLARYRWEVLKSRASAVPLTTITLVATDATAATAGATRGVSFARAGALARDLANTPPAHMAATRIADIASELGPAAGLTVEVFDRDQLIELGCGGIIAVNGGSDEPPRMIKLRYRPDGATAHLALVGKGIMYDSGGISLKPGDAVHATMKNDMSGAGDVLAAMLHLRDTGCPVAVTGYLMCTDNMPSGTAAKLGDVMTVRGGTTVEIVNTDAEGRLVMADALVLAAEEHPDAIVDIATLTGACMRALGEQIAGVMGNDTPLMDQIRRAGEVTDEPVWELPLEPRYRRQLESDVADIKNLGGANAGAITAALFLAEFVAGIPWAHIDIAGTAQSDLSAPWRPGGCTGFGARLLLQLADDFTAPAS
jgi:leucyl aminopeptidase